MKFFYLALISLFTSCTHPTRTIISHRGASGYLPEHTLEAVTLAHGLGVDFIEPDVVLTSDDVPIVIHDIILDEVTDVDMKFPDKRRDDGHYYAVDFTLKQIKSLTVRERLKEGKAKYPERFPTGKGNFHIATFEEYIDLVQGLNKSRGMNIGIYPEIKSPSFHQNNGKDISQIVLDTLKKQIYQETPVILQCFDYDEVKRIRTVLGYKGKLVQLIADNSWNESKTDYNHLMSDKGLEDVAMYADGLGMWLGHLLKDNGSHIIKKAHSLGMVVHAYTFRKDSLPEGYSNSQKLLDTIFNKLELDGLFADHPDIPLKFLKR